MDGLVLKEIALDKPRITIGRKPHNDIQIDNLAISGEHAAITTILQDAFLEDLNSTNGSYVNGVPVKKHALKDGDIVELGKYRLKFLTNTPAGEAGSGRAVEAPLDFIIKQASTARSTSDTLVAPPGGENPALPDNHTESPMTTSGITGGRWDHPSAESENATSVGVMQILSGRNAGRELALIKSLTTLGKPGVQVAVITRRSHGYFITHVEGTSFPVVNGHQLDAQAHPLQDHDVIELAGVKMEFYLRTPAT